MVRYLTVFNAIFNNISATCSRIYRGSQFHWWKKPEYSAWENHWFAASPWQALSHNVIFNFKLTTL